MIRIKSRNNFNFKTRSIRRKNKWVKKLSISILSEKIDPSLLHHDNDNNNNNDNNYNNNDNNNNDNNNNNDYNDNYNNYNNNDNKKK